MCEELDTLNREAYLKLTYGKFTEEKSQIDYDCEMEVAYIDECRRIVEDGEELPQFHKAEFCKKWREENVKPPLRNYDEETERKLELIRSSTAQFAVTKFMEHRQNGAEDFLLEQLGSGVLQIKGEE
jgi:hypothetical protein